MLQGIAWLVQLGGRGDCVAGIGEAARNRQVFRLYVTDRLTFAQIAEKMGSSADAVRKLWRRALEELRKHLDTPHESN